MPSSSSARSLSNQPEKGAPGTRPPQRPSSTPDGQTLPPRDTGCAAIQGGPSASSSEAVIPVESSFRPPTAQRERRGPRGGVSSPPGRLAARGSAWGALATPSPRKVPRGLDGCHLQLTMAPSGPFEGPGRSSLPTAPTAARSRGGARGLHQPQVISQAQRPHRSPPAPCPAALAMGELWGVKEAGPTGFTLRPGDPGSTRSGPSVCHPRQPCPAAQRGTRTPGGPERNKRDAGVGGHPPALPPALRLRRPETQSTVGAEAPPSARQAGGTAGCSQSRGSGRAPSQPQKARHTAGGRQDRALWARSCTRAYARVWRAQGTCAGAGTCTALACWGSARGGGRLWVTVGNTLTVWQSPPYTGGKEPNSLCSAGPAPTGWGPGGRVASQS